MPPYTPALPAHAHGPGASDTCGRRAEASPAPNKALIGAATGSCVAVALAALALLYVWHRRGSGGSAWAPFGCIPGAKGRAMLPPLAMPLGSLTLRVRMPCMQEHTAADTHSYPQQ